MFICFHSEHLVKAMVKLGDFEIQLHLFEIIYRYAGFPNAKNNKLVTQIFSDIGIEEDVLLEWFASFKPTENMEASEHFYPQISIPI